MYKPKHIKCSNNDIYTYYDIELFVETLFNSIDEELYFELPYYIFDDFIDYLIKNSFRKDEKNEDTSV